MSIKMSQEIQEYVDITNQDALKQWMVAVKQCIDELSRKAKSMQETTRSSIPTANDLEEKEDVDYVSGATIRRYTKIDGTVRYNTQT